MAGRVRPHGRARLGHPSPGMVDQDLANARLRDRGRGKDHTLSCPGATGSAVGLMPAPASAPAAAASAGNGEKEVSTLQQREHERYAREQSQRAQKRDCAPHRRKGASTRQQPPVLARVEAGEQLGLVDRAIRIAGLDDVDEVDRAAPVEALHKRDLPTAEGTGTVEPDGQLVHGSRYGERRLNGIAWAPC